MKKTFLSRWLMATALVGMIFVSSCNDDEDPVDPLVGNYSLSSATYLGLFNPTDGSTAEVATSIVGVGDIPVGAPISSLILGVLNGVPDCADPGSVTIELREDFSLWLTCDGTAADGQVASGVWTKDNETTVTLTISPTANIPTGLTLTLQDVVVTSSQMSTNVEGIPLPKDATVELGGALPGDGGINLQLISSSLVLTK